MSFQAPLALLGLLVIPVLVLVYVLARRRQRRGAGSFSNPARVPTIIPSSPGGRRYVPFVLEKDVSFFLSSSPATRQKR